MLRRYIALCFCVLVTGTSFAQYFQKEKELASRVENATDDSIKVIALSQLAEFYYIHRATTKADSVINLQLMHAELSTNKNLLIHALFDKSVINVPLWTSSKNFDRTIQYLEKGVQYAREIGREDYQVIAYLRKAYIYRKRGQLESAMNEVGLASTTLGKDGNDSLSAAIAIESGDIAVDKGRFVDAYKHYNKAYDIAYGIKNITLQSEVFHRYSALYLDLNETKLAKDNLITSLELNKKFNNEPGILLDYFDLARLTEKKEHVEKVMELAIKTGDIKSIIRAKRLMFSYLMVKVKDPAKTLQYLNSNEDLLQSYINSGLPAYNFNLGNIYKYAGFADSALYYFNKGEVGLTEAYDPYVTQAAFTSMAECYQERGNTQAAINYYQKALEINRRRQDLSSIEQITLQLSNLYYGTGNYKYAFDFQKQYIDTKDSVRASTEKSEVVLLEVDRENKKHQKDLENMAIQESRIRNLQYMGISAAIATLFIFMMLMGMFPISKVTIKMLSFFAFICLFEFIVLLIDSYLHKLTHGQPLKIWLIKIFLIAILVPIQHFLEHGMVHFLASQRLFRMRQKLSLKRWLLKLKKPAPKTEAGMVDKFEIEEDTAVL
jgi:tetratricopeptide (TPR) repeat protein